MANNIPTYKNETNIPLVEYKLDRWTGGDFIPQNAKELKAEITEKFEEAKARGSKSIAVEFARRPYCESARDAIALVRAMGTENAQISLDQVGMPEILRKAKVSAMNALPDRALYAHVHKFVEGFSGLTLYQCNAPDHKKGTEFNFSDVVSLMRGISDDEFQGDVTYIQLPESQVDHNETMHTSKAMLGVKTKTPGMFLLLAIEQDVDGVPTSIRPALGFNIAE